MHSERHLVQANNPMHIPEQKMLWNLTVMYSPASTILRDQGRFLAMLGGSTHENG